MMKIQILLLIILFLILGCRKNGEIKKENEQAPHKKIISLVTSLTEILFELKMGKSIIGVSKFCTYPDSVNTIEKIGGLYDVSMEKIIRMHPDYIVMDQSRYMEKQLPKLEIIDPEIISLKTETIADIYKNINILGEKFNKDLLARQLVASIKDSINNYIPKPIRGNRKKVLLIVGRAPGKIAQIYAAGKKTFVSEIAEKCGLQNIIKEEGYIQVNAEFIYKSELDYIFEINAGIPGENIKEIKNEWKIFWNEKGIAVSTKVFNEDFMVIPGSRVYLGVKRIVESLD